MTTELILEDDVITAEMLNTYGIDCREVRRRWPHAVERVALDGQTCWLEEDLGSDFSCFVTLIEEDL